MAYGGFIRFTIEYDGGVEDFRSLDLRISGNRINIYYVSEERMQPGRPYNVSIQLTEENFKRYGDNGRVDRDHMLMALTNIELMMIKAKYVRNQERVR